MREIAGAKIGLQVGWQIECRLVVHGMTMCLRWPHCAKEKRAPGFACGD
jgi:hypothetical protein